MSATTETELKALLQKLDQEPTNLDLINSIAIGYFENPSMLKDNEDLKYFELAYKTQKAIKSTHNLAWYLYFEWGKEQRAFEIQKECMEMNPKSFYPYYQYGYMLLNKGQYEEAIHYLSKAYNLKNRRDISHNIGYCHFQLDELEKAREFFTISASDWDLENRSLFNLALTEFQSGNLEITKSIAEKLFDEVNYSVHKIVSGYEIGLLFFLLKNYYKATESLFKQNIDGLYDLFDWKELSYSLYRTAKPVWKEQIGKGIEKRVNMITEIKSNSEDWENFSIEEKKEKLTEFQAEIKVRQATLAKGLIEPIPNLKEKLWTEYCGCLLYDCKRHGNSKND